MSHSTLNDLKHFIALAKKVDIPFMVDTEGSQIRTGDLKTQFINLKKGEKVKIHSKKTKGDKKNVSLKPPSIISQLEKGDVLHPDFNALELCVEDTSTIKKGYVVSIVTRGGLLGRNKGVVVDSVSGKRYDLPPLSTKDYKSIALGLKNNVKHIAASFMRSGAFVDEVCRATKGKMKIISKVECVDGLDNLDDIIKKSDYILLDRGDLSKEVLLEKVPYHRNIGACCRVACNHAVSGLKQFSRDGIIQPQTDDGTNGRMADSWHDPGLYIRFHIHVIPLLFLLRRRHVKDRPGQDKDRPGQRQMERGHRNGGR